MQKERKRLRAAVLVVRERGTLRPSPEQVDGLCLALDLAALKALADTLEPADVPLEVCAAALTAALEATGGGSLDDTRMSWAQRQAQQRMLAAQLQEVAAAEASERQAAVAAAKLLREEREAAAAATKLLRVGPQTVNFKHPFQTPVRFFKDRIEIPAEFRTVLKSLLDFKKPVEIPLPGGATAGRTAGGGRAGAGGAGTAHIHPERPRLFTPVHGGVWVHYGGGARAQQKYARRLGAVAYVAYVCEPILSRPVRWRRSAARSPTRAGGSGGGDRAAASGGAATARAAGGGREAAGRAGDSGGGGGKVAEEGSGGGGGGERAAATRAAGGGSGGGRGGCRAAEEGASGTHSPPTVSVQQS